MKRTLLILLICLTAGFTLQGQEKERIPAFPGAEGHGMYTTGGRGGRVIKVTNLNDSGEGSFRAAVEASGPRIVVFEVSGTIALESKLFIKNDHLTIAGQTAPGDGICLKNYCVYITASNVIMRYMRFRMGDEAKAVDDALGGQGSRNMIIDHCSMSWSIDECASFYANEDFTMQWCLLTESLRNSFHYGSHGFGGIWGGNRASFHHNLLAHHSNRNPRFRGHKRNSPVDAELVDLRNNVFYNYNGTCYGSEGGGNYNMVNNYYKSGPASGDPDKEVLFVNTATAEYNWLELEGAHGVFYVSGNYVSNNPGYSKDNWTGAVAWEHLTTLERVKSEVEFDRGNIRTEDAETAYLKILDYAGASISRDAVDQRAVHDTRTGTVTITDGGKGSTNGYIDTQEAAGGWPVLKSLPAPEDSDADGMPDAWELARGLDPDDSADGNKDRDQDGYTNIEEYINSLTLDHIDPDSLLPMPGGGKSESEESLQRDDVDEKDLYTGAIKINFQPEEDYLIPQGYMADFGGKYCDKWTGYSYGWLEAYHPHNGINAGETGVWETFRSFIGEEGKPYSWEIELPEGNYRIRLGLGGRLPGGEITVLKIEVEGHVLEDPDGIDLLDEHILENVTVMDGQLSLRSIDQSRICFIEIEPMTKKVEK